ncbi:MAG: GNAT family N-acetyltransferase [Lachnospiraceae bacterium]
MKEEQFLDDGRIIRTASIDDLNAVSSEAECFPPAEAASKADFERRIRAYGNHFWLMFENGQLVSFVDGMVTNQADLTDDLYEHAELHDESGDWQMIFGVNTIPSCRKKGYAGELLRQAISDAKEQGRKGLVLTCKDKLIPYYSSFGFENEGISMSVHGNVVWYQMRLKF